MSHVILVLSFNVRVIDQTQEAVTSKLRSDQRMPPNAIFAVEAYLRDAVETTAVIGWPEPDQTDGGGGGQGTSTTMSVPSFGTPRDGAVAPVPPLDTVVVGGGGGGAPSSLFLVSGHIQYVGVNEHDPGQGGGGLQKILNQINRYTESSVVNVRSG